MNVGGTIVFPACYILNSMYAEALHGVLLWERSFMEYIEWSDESGSIRNAKKLFDDSLLTILSENRALTCSDNSNPSGESKRVQITFARILRIVSVLHKSLGTARFDPCRKTITQRNN